MFPKTAESVISREVLTLLLFHSVRFCIKLYQFAWHSMLNIFRFVSVASNI